MKVRCEFLGNEREKSERNGREKKRKKLDTKLKTK
jgi:hypothetical protein